MRGTLLLGVLAALAGQAIAQSQPDAVQILKRVAATYRAAKEYELVSTSTGTAVPGRLLIAFRAPNRYRMEGEDPDLDKDDGSVVPVLLVHDGSSLWLYRPKANAWIAFTLDDVRGDLKPESMDDAAMGRFRSAADLTGLAKFLREDTIEIGGSKRDCFVLSVPIPVSAEKTLVYTWWVEKNSSHVLREDREGSSVVFSTIKLNEPLPDDLFRFTPPANARKMGGN